MTDTFQADHNLDYVRLLDEAPTKEASLVLNVTGSTYDPSRKTSSTDTKSGTVSSVGEISVKDDLDAIDGPFEANRILEESLYAKRPIERWHVNCDYKNSDGKYYAVYERGIVTDVSQSGNAGSNLTKKYTITVNGTPQRGWLTLSKAMSDQANYIFKGVDKDDGSDNGGGTAYNFDTDRKIGEDDASKTVAHQ